MPIFPQDTGNCIPRGVKMKKQEYDIIEVNHERCTGCRDCVEACPSPLANFVHTTESGKKVIDIDPDYCIACGECVKRCKHGGRDYNDDTERFFRDLGDRRIVIIAHPSIKLAFGDKWQAVLRWFQQNGASGIYDGSWGADIATWCYIKNIDQGTKKVISTHCPAVVRYMEVYHPDSIKNVSTVHSPISCEAVYVRDYVKKNYAVAALTPCPAMSLEFAETEHVEYNVTFKRLKEHFMRKRIEFKPISDSPTLYDYDDMSQGLMGGMYPFPAGLRSAITQNDLTIPVINSDGIDNVYREIEEYLSAPEEKQADIFEALSCGGGCGMGIGSYDEDDCTTLQMKTLGRIVESDARSRRKTNLSGTDRQFKLFEDRLNPKSLVRKFEDLREKPSKERIRENRDELEAFFAALESENAPSPAAGTAPAAPAPAAAPVSEQQAETTAEIAQTAVKLKKITETIVSDVSDIREKMGSIDNTNTQSASMAGIIENILSKVIVLCQANESIDAESLPQLIIILDKLQNATISLKNNLTESKDNAAVLSDAVNAMSAAADELSSDVDHLILTVAKK